ncbi:hypothetical protein GCM10012275_59750 [Longimycelium tulufanense]|uniref:TadE-like domain-containing protein n=2 Tax=Longimycelium tulufanense TaxID=907463 RepID=A0A8J3CE61_9PSEU|nr:hypothetical protein GCM10012275_59750 [Longimycelium tulufanense]
MILRRWCGDERGSVAVELTLLTPVLILLLLFVVFCGRVAEARLRVDDAAHQAVRAATLARSNTQATAEARATMEVALGQAGVSCSNLSVDTQTGGLQPGSTVTTVIHCEIGLSDLSLLGVPGSITVEASAASVVDQWRGTVTAGGTGT